jgi:hypothetical protein
MFDQLMQQVSGANVQIPVGYVLMGVAGLYSVYWAAKKALVLGKLLAVGILAKFSIAMLGSSALFLTGLAGVGNSVGNFTSGPSVDSKEPVAVAYIDKDTIKKIVTNAKQDSDGNRAREMAFQYAVEQDKKTGEKVVYVSAKEDTQEKPANSPLSPWTVFTTSLGMIMVGITWGLRRWHE